MQVVRSVYAEPKCKCEKVRRRGDPGMLEGINCLERWRPPVYSGEMFVKAQGRCSLATVREVVFLGE